jgi:ribonuclease P protein component
VQRLKTRAQFEAVLAGGSTVSRTEHFALHRSGFGADPAQDGSRDSSNEGPGSGRTQALLFADRTQPWIGAVIPKRWARRAVTRNAIRRQIYTVSQDFESALPAAAHVVRLRSGFDKAKFTSATSVALKTAVRQELVRLFGGARK